MINRDIRSHNNTLSGINNKSSSYTVLPNQSSSSVAGAQAQPRNDENNISFNQQQLNLENPFAQYSPGFGIDMKRLQMEIMANEEKHNKRIFEEYKKNKLLISQNKKLLEQLQESHKVQVE